ncbi:hypothetical protein SeLEV6574_g05656 [Synchytrium endobioticum]|uniref:Uncharacterized protein n=1 Tax=Synchytrium endobioticum TaxID=286115 RepID=A0A507CT65_9FUNG|nr:hypothetical protein SeLEV6574_g05656 [Synchytrium endobioticum]
MLPLQQPLTSLKLQKTPVGKKLKRKRVPDTVSIYHCVKDCLLLRPNLSQCVFSRDAFNVFVNKSAGFSSPVLWINMFVRLSSNISLIYLCCVCDSPSPA